MDNQNRTALILSAIALAIAIASAVMSDRVDTRTASNDAAPGTTGLARPHAPLDRAAGEPIQTVGAPPRASIRQRP